MTIEQFGQAHPWLALLATLLLAPYFLGAFALWFAAVEALMDFIFRKFNLNGEILAFFWQREKERRAARLAKQPAVADPEDE